MKVQFCVTPIKEEISISIQTQDPIYKKREQDISFFGISTNYAAEHI